MSVRGRRAVSEYRRFHPLPREVFVRAANTRRGRSPSQEWRDKISVALKRRLSDPVELARHAARAREACNRPEYLARVRGPGSPAWIPDREEVRTRRRIKYLMYGMIKRVLRRKDERKNEKTERVLGYDSVRLRSHLERLFRDGMSWPNYGRRGWVVDHIVPISAFPKTAGPAEVNALTNLQPMWWRDNDRKGGVRR